MEALDTIDEALRMSGEKNLFERYKENRDRIFLGNPGIGSSRITVVKKGEGGIY